VPLFPVAFLAQFNRSPITLLFLSNRYSCPVSFDSLMLPVLARVLNLLMQKNKSGPLPQGESANIESSRS
jgi:hypothetical protein